MKRPIASPYLLPIGVLVGSMMPVAAVGQGSIVAWGFDNQGQVSETPGGTDFTQISGGAEYSTALRTDGSIASWGIDDQSQYDSGQVTGTPAKTGFTHLVAGWQHGVALRPDGSIVVWGEQWTFGSSGGIDSVTPLTGFTQLAAGAEYSLALRADGSIAGWGGDLFSTVSLRPTESGFTQVSANVYHALALRSDGSIVAWGMNHGGQISDTPSGTGFTQVAAGQEHSLALRADGSIAAWGRDDQTTYDFGQVTDTPLGTGFTQVAAGYWHSLALRADGSIVSWGWDDRGLVTDSPSGTGFTHIAAGTFHSLALRSDNVGSAYCFGDGTGSACPCSANGFPGQGCANSGGSGGATLSASGNAYLGDDTFRLDVTGVPGNKPGLILRGANQLVGNPVGDGLHCATGSAARSQVQVTSAGNTHFSDFNGNPFGAASYGAGVSTNYQFWYRDQQNPCSGSGFNFSNAWTVTWGL